MLLSPPPFPLENMSAHLLNKVKKARTGNAYAKAILFYLADCATEKGCFPSQKQISEDMEISLRTVIRQLDHLEKRGFITRQFEYKTGERNKTFYTILGDSVTPIMSDSPTPKMGDSEDKWVTPSPKMGDSDDSAYKEYNDNITTSIGETPAPKNKKVKKGVHPDYAEGMKYLESQIGAIPDYAAQGGALNWMFEQQVTLDQIKYYFPRHSREMGKFRKSYLSFKKVVCQWIKDDSRHTPNTEMSELARQMEEVEREERIRMSRVAAKRHEQEAERRKLAAV